MLGTPTHKEMERQMIGLERDKFQYEGLGGRGGTVQAMGTQVNTLTATHA